MKGYHSVPIVLVFTGYKESMPSPHIVPAALIILSQYRPPPDGLDRPTLIAADDLPDKIVLPWMPTAAPVFQPASGIESGRWRAE